MLRRRSKKHQSSESLAIVRGIDLCIVPVQGTVTRKMSPFDDVIMIASCVNTGLILGLRSANERRRYKVTPSLMGWEQI